VNTLSSSDYPACRRHFLRNGAVLLSGTLLAPRLAATTALASNGLRLIDAHVHFPGNTAETLALLEAIQAKLLNISIGRTRSRAAALAEVYRDLARKHPDRFGWCTSIDVPEPDDRDYVKNTIRQLDQDFADGAVACKIWKQFGLGAKKRDGSPLFVDDPLLEPIFARMEEIGKPALLHIGEPRDVWEPLHPGGIYYEYYSKHPEAHYYGRTDVPSYETLLDSRDHVVARHPRLTVIGAHLGSLESDVDALAQRFDRYPNFHADTSGVSRALSLSEQNRDKVRHFLIRYQDRLVFGSDRSSLNVHSEAAPMLRQASLEELRQHITSALAFYGSTETVLLRDRQVQGLGLPANVVKKLFLENARSLYPGL